MPTLYLPQKPYCEGSIRYITDLNQRTEIEPFPHCGRYRATYLPTREVFGRVVWLGKESDLPDLLESWNKKAELRPGGAFWEYSLEPQ